MFINTRSSIMLSTMRPEGSLRWEPYTVILESQLTRPDVGGLHSDHDHHRRGDQWHGGDQGRSCGIEQETGVSSSGELLNKGTHQIWNRDRTHNFSVKPNHSTGNVMSARTTNFSQKGGCVVFTCHVLLHYFSSKKVGVGDADMRAMVQLDSDKARLHSKGDQAARDIVQFVRE